MKILFLSHYFPPEVNAPATRTFDHCRRWVKAGHEVTVITCQPNCPTGRVYPGYRNTLWPQKETIDGVHVIRVWTFLAANAGKIRRTLNFLTYMVSAFVLGIFQKRPDVIITTSPQFFCGLAGVFLGWLRRVKTVLEVRDIWPASIAAVGAINNRSVLGILIGLEQLMYCMATHIITVGAGYRDHILERTKGEVDVTIITNGVDLNRLQPTPQDELFLEEHDLHDKFVCSYIGTIGMAHGLKVVIEAAQILKESGRDDIRFALVGDGADRPALQIQSKEKQVDDIVRFVGLVPHTQVPQIFSSSNAVLIHLKNNQLFETVIPSKLFEAMAMDCPIVMGVRGEALGIMEDADCGIAIEPCDAQQLADAVQLLADDEFLRTSLGENGRRVVMERYNRDTLASEYLDLLLEVSGFEPEQKELVGRETQPQTFKPATRRSTSPEESTNV